MLYNFYENSFCSFIYYFHAVKNKKMQERTNLTTRKNGWGKT